MARGDEDIEGGSENELSLMQFKLFSFFKPACVDLFTEKLSRMSTIHLGIFHPGIFFT